MLAKWAMTLDGRTATRTGSSRWVSNARSREIVHALRGRVDAILVGRRTAQLDDPLLTARPAGPRTALRVVADTHGSLSLDSRLVGTARQTPLLVAVGPEASEERRRQLADAGCEVLVCRAKRHGGRLLELLDELGRRRMTNVLVEGGGRLTGSLLDLGQLNEVHVFIAPKLVAAPPLAVPVAGEGIDEMSRAVELDAPQWQLLDSDLYLVGRVRKCPSPSAT